VLLLACLAAAWRRRLLVILPMIMLLLIQVRFHTSIMIRSMGKRECTFAADIEIANGELHFEQRNGASE